MASEGREGGGGRRPGSWRERTGDVLGLLRSLACDHNMAGDYNTVPVL